uniref:Uncharacterized protein n=1 Tax=Ditylum brightwellii TaxID=49249 RepID=A0A6V2A1S9_9STRA|mmetsp:Transcript_63713/g.94612  ORF Transcript_63713/g.94612 Transcript_63713/m.94612 type:complete len:380 (+) Transcript_63713:671-1810(+)
MSEKTTESVSPNAAPKTAQKSAAIAATVTPTDESKSRSTTTAVSLCRFHIDDISFQGDVRVENFDVILNPNKHGIYDLIHSVFEHFLTKLTGWSIESRLWTVQYGDNKFVSHKEKCIEELYSKNTHECTFNERRVFGSEEMKAFVELRKNSKGNFSLDHKPLNFAFTLEDTDVPQNHKAYQDAIETPQCTKSVLAIQYNASQCAKYVTQSEHDAIIELAKKYATFYKGMNAWTCNRPDHLFVPCKPQAPVWGRGEMTIMGLFVNAGWKYAASWKYGLQYAFPHRTKTSTQGKWYYLNKNYYMIESTGRSMTRDQKIIAAKKKCKVMMGEFLKEGPPKPVQRPMSAQEWFMAHRDRAADDEWLGINSHIAPLPKRLRTQW